MELEMPDKRANIELHGRKYLQRDGVVALPDAAGQEVLRADIPGVKRYRKAWGGVDLDELERRYRAWEEAHR